MIVTLQTWNRQLYIRAIRIPDGFTVRDLLAANVQPGYKYEVFVNGVRIYDFGLVLKFGDKVRAIFMEDSLGPKMDRIPAAAD